MRAGRLLVAVAAALAVAPAAHGALMSGVDGSRLWVQSDASQAITITCPSGNVKINGGDPDGGAAACASITAISVMGGPGANTIDLSGVGSAFGLPTGGTPVAIYGDDGNDTIDGSAFGDEIDGMDGADVMRGGAGTDFFHAWDAGDTADGQGATDLYEASLDVVGVITIADTGPAAAGCPADCGDTVFAIGTPGDDAGATAITAKAGEIARAAGKILFSGIEDPQIYGREGNDIIDADQAPVAFTLYGGEDYDYLGGSNAADRLFVGDGGGTADGHAGDDEFVVTFGTLGSAIIIDGFAGGVDRLIVEGTEAVDVVSVSATQITRGSETVMYDGIDFPVVQGKGGDDVFFVASSSGTQLDVEGGENSDAVVVTAWGALGAPVVANDLGSTGSDRVSVPCDPAVSIGAADVTYGTEQISLFGIESPPTCPAPGAGLTVDQEQTSKDDTVGPLLIGGGLQELAQTFTAGVSAKLTHVTVPVQCTSGALIVELQGVTATGEPDGIVAASASFAASLLPAFSAPPSMRVFAFPNPAALTTGTTYALVLRNTTGFCGIFRGAFGDSYAGGKGYFDELPGPPGWLLLSPADGEDLPFQTLYDNANPVVTLALKPDHPSYVDTADFLWVSSEPGTTVCKLDTGAFGACAAAQQQSYTSLSDASHTFTVQITDSAGNVGSATHTWKVEAQDSDGDALKDVWETSGIDANADGTVDLALHQAPFSANPAKKDVFVEVDWMDCAVAASTCASTPHDDKPDPNALPDVVAAFAAAPGGGITLHAMLDEAIAHTYGLEPTSPAWAQLKNGGSAACDGSFGTASERASANCGAILAARRLAFHYAVFGHDHAQPGVGGEAELPGNDLVVTIGGHSPTEIAASGGKRATEAGVFMHELGHNLGLKHGGGDHVNGKPNYLSVMNYSFTTLQYDPTRPLDYSPSALATLIESALSEPAGIGGPAGRNTIYCVGGVAKVVPANGPIDWNGNGVSTETGVAADVNCDGEQSSLTGFADWTNVLYDFRGTPGFASGPMVIAPDAPREPTGFEALAAARSVDFDGDGVTNYPDNCPADANAAQHDGDADGSGDVCDAETAVAIDVKPGSAVNPIDVSAQGTVPVAILSTPSFDAPARVGPTSLTFGKTGEESSLVRCNARGEDVNGDGLRDLVCHFGVSQLGLAAGDTEAVVNGELVLGGSIRGSDAVRVRD